MRVVILGGYGVFGGKLAQLLLRDGIETVVAGRNEVTAKAFCAEHGGTPAVLDKDNPSDIAGWLQQGCVLVDAVGPFQAYSSYALAELAIKHRCHYLDLSDDAGFTAGITALDRAAKQAGVMICSGVSSTPALSSVIVDDLAQGFDEIDVIETTILPGNRAPRGLSVMRAILGQVGRPLRQWRGGAWIATPAWGKTSWHRLSKGPRRPACAIGAPELELFPKAYHAKSVLFRAGLELRSLHFGLAALGWLHRLRALPRLDRMTRFLHWVAKRFEPLGTDEGGMIVTVTGKGVGKEREARSWRFHIGAGRGPFVPAIPAKIMIGQLITGEITPGARPALSAFTRSAVEQELTALGATLEQDSVPVVPLFQRALGAELWGRMPQQWQSAHDLTDRHVLIGHSSVFRGHRLLAKLIATLFRFPPAAASVPVTVTMERHGQGETWLRNFDGHRFRSTLTPAGKGTLYERFGPFKFELHLPVSEGRMGMEVRRGWFCGLPMPRWSLPISETSEYVEDGVFRFDVRLLAPFAGLVVHYKGQLSHQSAPHSD